nr:hypothetical protein BaRGS_027233 [Batillaria attramentaria]
MGILALPGELATFFMRLIGLQLLMLYGFARKFWDYTLKPLLQPLADMASAIPPEELNLAGILEQFVKLCLMWVMLCVSVLVAVWEILTRPFSGVLEAIRKFFWQLDYEMKAKDK